MPSASSPPTTPGTSRVSNSWWTVTEPARDGTEARAHPADVPDALTERLYAFHAGRDEFRHYAEPLPG
ncbi:hypothetical protein OIM90_05080 [Streptomyces sp. AD16]|nr:MULTISPECIES: hypothetical protein [unclassified Streptomyces]WDV30963.1 hypothetical protein OIM90_05080 [Streptomyces sp. AD16]